MAEDTVFYLSNDPNDEGIPLAVDDGILTSTSYLSAGKGITKSNLVRVEIGTKVETIGDEAFQFCSALQSVTIPDSVTSIGSNAFSSCGKLQSVTIGDGVTTIGNKAFGGCTQLQLLTIPNSVTGIDKDAFSSSGISTVTIGVATASLLDLIPNSSQDFFGQSNVFIKPTIGAAFIRPGIISGDETTLDDWSSTDVQIALRYYKPSLRTFEQSREGLLIADLTKIAAIENVSITEIKWFKKNTNDDTYTQQTDYNNKRTYPYDLLDIIDSVLIKVQCTYSVNGNEITVVSKPTITDQTTIDTIADNVFEKVGDNFTNAEFRKTLTKVSFFNDITTISDDGLFVDESFVYENMQEVEVPKTVTSITGTPFPTNTRYYIRSIKKYKNPDTYNWVNETNKYQLYFYLNETSDQLAKTRNDDGVELAVVPNGENNMATGNITAPFVYNKAVGSSPYTDKKFKNVDYLYSTSLAPSYQAEESKYGDREESVNAVSQQILTNRYKGNKYQHIITIPDYTTTDASGNKVYLDESWVNKCVDNNSGSSSIIQYKLTDTGDIRTLDYPSTTLEYKDTVNFTETVTLKNVLYFPQGVVSVNRDDITNNEYLRIFDIILDDETGDANKKTVKIAIANESWNTDDCDACFPGNSKLILKDGTKKIFHEIEVGDEIQVCSRDMDLFYSKVIFLPHLQNNKSEKYIKFTTTSNQTIRATDLHLLPVLDKNNKLQNVIAKNITKEDKLYVLNNGKGVPEEIKTIETIQEKGIYTCLVKEGEYIVVDNIVASPFPGDGLDISYISKYAFSYTTLRLIANGFSLLDSMGILKYTAPLLRFMVFLVVENCRF